MYALVIHSYHMSKPAESSFTEYVIRTSSDLFSCYFVLPGNTQDALFFFFSSVITMTMKLMVLAVG